MPQKLIFDMAVARGPFIDQSQCINISIKDPDKLTSVHYFAWRAVSNLIIHILHNNFDYIFNVKCTFYLQGLKSSMY